MSLSSLTCVFCSSRYSRSLSNIITQVASWPILSDKPIWLVSFSPSSFLVLFIWATETIGILFMTCKFLTAFEILAPLSWLDWVWLVSSSNEYWSMNKISKCSLSTNALNAATVAGPAISFGVKTLSAPRPSLEYIPFFRFSR